MKPLTSADLDNMKCGTPGCDHSTHDSEMYIHAQCHVGAPLTACYHIEEHCMSLSCAVCGKLVVKIAVESDYDPWQ